MNPIGASSPAPCVWFCGLSGAGKSTVAQEVYRQLTAQGVPAYVLDGDVLRKGLCSDLGFSDADRRENLRRVREVAKAISCSGVMPLIACITPFDNDRQKARELLSENGFILVYMDTPLEECQRRDPKELYKRVNIGEIKNFTGIDSRFEIPNDADIRIKNISSVDAAKMIIDVQPVQSWIRKCKGETI
jgi:adenylyl-sulfate kinase